MLEIVIREYELFNNETQEFTNYPSIKIELEHSLISLSKWESRWHKPYLNKYAAKTTEEVMDYIKCMTITKRVPDSAYDFLTESQIKEITNYITDPMTATVIQDTNKKSGQGEILTSELIYYYMLTANIPIECEKWHLNRLITLLSICSIKSQPAKQQSTNEILRNNAALNAARKKQLNTKG